MCKYGITRRCSGLVGGLHLLRFARMRRLNLKQEANGTKGTSQSEN
jgi:hypothetical protein